MQFRRKGRSWAALLTLGIVWLVLLLAYLWLDAAAWIVVLLVLLTVPAVWEFVMERNAGITLDKDEIRWYSGRRQGQLPRADLDHVRLNRRLDLTMRVALVTHQGTRIRLPQECIPPVPEFEAALDAEQIKIERHPFSLL